MPEIERHYPLPRPESGNDPRFCFGLLHEAAELLERHGYPPLTGRDAVELNLALFQVIYAPATD
jgi:hypothetical protein